MPTLWLPTRRFIDDIFSLGTLVMMTSLAKGDTSPLNIVRLVCCSFGFLALGVFLAIKVFPHLPPLLSRIPGSKYASVPQLVGTVKRHSASVTTAPCRPTFPEGSGRACLPQKRSLGQRPEDACRRPVVQAACRARPRRRRSTLTQ